MKQSKRKHTASMKIIAFLLLITCALSSQAQRPNPNDTIIPEIGINISGKGSQKTYSTNSPVLSSINNLKNVSADLLDTGTIYFLNSGDLFVPYKWNPASAAADDGVTVLERRGTSKGRFEIYYEDAIMFDWWSPDKTGATDVSNKLQQAINFTLSNGKAGKLKISGGRYRVKNVGIYKRNKNNPKEYDYATMVLEGATPASAVSLGPGSNTIFFTNDKDGMIMWGQEMLNCQINNIYFEGVIAAPQSAQQTVEMSTADWLKDGIRNNRKSPGQVGFSVDPVHSLVPGNDQYPGMSSFYTNAQTGGSSTVTFNNVSFYRLNLGIMVSSNGHTQNCDNIVWNGGNASYTRVLWASGQTQSRANEIHGIYTVGGIEYIINCVSYGQQKGSAPNVSNCSFAGSTKYFIYGNGNFGGMEVTASEFEQIWSLGIHNVQPITFVNTLIRRMLPGQDGAPLSPVFAQGSNWHFKGGSIEHFDNDFMGPLNFNVVNLSFDGTYIKGNPPANRIGSLNTTNYYNTIIKTAIGEINYFDNHTYTELNKQDINGVPMLAGNVLHLSNGEKYMNRGDGFELLNGDKKKVKTNLSNGTGYFISDNAWKYVAGLPLAVTENVDYANDIYAAAPTLIGYVSSISRDTVKLSYMPYGLDPNVTYSIKIPHTPKSFVRVIGDTKEGSDVISNVTSEVGQHFYAGVLIKGASLPEGTRVKSVDIAGRKIVLSKAAAATANGVQLYDADLLKTAAAYVPGATNSGSGFFRGDIIENTFMDPRTRDTLLWFTQNPWFNAITAQQTKAVAGGAIAGGAPASTGSSISGDFTSALTGLTNVSGSSAYEGQYMQIGNHVTYSFQVSVSTSGNGAARLGISLPVASRFTAAGKAAGTANTDNGVSGTIAGDNNRLVLKFNSPGRGTYVFSCQVTYKVVAP